MKTITALLFCCVFHINTSMAQSLRYAIALPYIGLGAYSKQHMDPFSFTRNQAALAQVQHAGIGVFGERRFLLAETSSYAFAAVFRTKLGNIGLQGNYAGFKNFNENKIGLAYARSLGPKVDVGVQFNYYSYRIPAYPGASSMNFEAGVLLHFNEKLHGGVHVYNPVGGKLGKTGNEKLAALYNIGLGYDASSIFFVSAEVIKEEGKPVNCIGGMEYRFAGKFFARLGMISESTALFAGAGLAWNNLRLDVSASYHPQLGFSPGILLITNFKGKTE